MTKHTLIETTLKNLTKDKIGDWDKEQLLLGHVLMHKRFRERRSIAKETIFHLHQQVVIQMKAKELMHSKFDNLDEEEMEDAIKFQNKKKERGDRNAMDRN